MSKVTHSNLLIGYDAPLCIGCNEYFTVKHFLLDGYDFSQVRHRYYQVNSRYNFSIQFLPKHLLNTKEEINS